MIARNNLDGKVTLAGAFCMGKCQQGVCVSVNDNVYSVSPDTVEEFFKNEVLTKA